MTSKKPNNSKLPSLKVSIPLIRLNPSTAAKLRSIPSSKSIDGKNMEDKLLKRALPSCARVEDAQLLLNLGNVSDKVTKNENTITKSTQTGYVNVSEEDCELLNLCKAKGLTKSFLMKMENIAHEETRDQNNNSQNQSTNQSDVSIPLIDLSFDDNPSVGDARIAQCYSNSEQNKAILSSLFNQTNKFDFTRFHSLMTNKLNSLKFISESQQVDVCKLVEELVSEFMERLKKLNTKGNLFLQQPQNPQNGKSTTENGNRDLNESSSDVLKDNNKCLEKHAPQYEDISNGDYKTLGNYPSKRMVNILEVVQGTQAAVIDQIECQEGNVPYNTYFRPQQRALPQATVPPTTAVSPLSDPQQRRRKKKPDFINQAASVDTLQYRGPTAFVNIRQTSELINRPPTLGTIQQRGLPLGPVLPKATPYMMQSSVFINHAPATRNQELMSQNAWLAGQYQSQENFRNPQRFRRYTQLRSGPYPPAPVTDKYKKMMETQRRMWQSRAQYYPNTTWGQSYRRAC